MGQDTGAGLCRLRGCHYCRIFHSAICGEQVNGPRDGRPFLTDGHIYAKYIVSFLVYDRIDGDDCFPSAPVTDNKFPLSSSDGDHGVNSFYTCLKWFSNGLANNNTGGHLLDVPELLGLNRSFAVNRRAETVNNSADKGFANGYLSNSPCPFYKITFFDFVVFSKNNSADIIFLKI
jgi:hypothetical protein